MAIRHFSDVDWASTLSAGFLMLFATAALALALSLRWDGTVFNLETGKRRPSLKPRVAGSYRLLWLLLFIATVGVGLVAEAAAQDEDGLYGQTGAAWMQAAGSVVAIVAAIIVDQGASRRFRQDRMVREQAMSARRAGAIAQAAEALENAAAELRNTNVANGQRVGLSSPSIQRIKGAGAALEYLHQQGAELDVPILAALCLSLEMYKVDSEWALKTQPIIGPKNVSSYASSLEAAAKRQRSIFSDAFSHVHRECP